MAQIHPSAIVEPGAQLAADVTVGAGAYIGPHVVLGAGCVVHHHATLEGHTVAGEKNEFYPYCLIGGKPQDLKYRGGDCRVIIGSHNRFREYSTVNIGTEDGGWETRVGNHGLFMAGVHLGHDSLVGNHVILANGVMLAGHVELGDYVIISGGSAVTHFGRIGQMAFIGGLSGVQHDIPPFMIAEGFHPEVRGVNQIGLRRRGFSEERIEALWQAYRLIYGRAAAGTVQERCAKVLATYPDNADLQLLTGTIVESAGGKNGRYRELFRKA
ncbi:MAG: acyl-ACP--UDP-N-acetylglucosamine O-acyltransferase [Phycisphaerae bacterium]